MSDAHQLFHVNLQPQITLPLLQIGKHFAHIRQLYQRLTVLGVVVS
jgi:hypothetical protein